MGLPQVSSGGSNEERLGQLSQRTQNYAHCSSVSTFAVDGLCVEYVSIPPESLSISSTGESSYNGKEGDGTFDDSRKPRRNRDIVPDAPKGKFGPEEIGCWNAKQEVDVTPVSRIVGFQANEADICCGQLSTSDSSDEVDLVANDTGSRVRKRMLSPLSQLILPDNCGGDILNMGCDMPHVKTETASNLRTQDLRKSNDGSNDQLSTPISLFSNCKEWTNASYGSGRKASFILFDGPSPVNHESSDVFLSSPRLCNLESSSILRKHVGNKTSNSLPSSPLGRKSCERTETADGLKPIRRQIEMDYTAISNIRLSLDGSDAGTPVSAEKKGFNVIRKPLEDFQSSSLDSARGFNWPIFHDLGPNLSGIKPSRTLSGHCGRRSLVGSFEESLLSGRLSFDSVYQKIDGFLAVLSVTGGNFSPKSQKLPFSVTSVYGDSYLLYYASIALPSKTGQKFTRSFSNDDAQSVKSRLRIPMKGRIQLTFLRQRTTLASTKTSAEPEQQKVREMTVKERIVAAVDKNPSLGLDLPLRNTRDDKLRYKTSSSRPSSPVRGHDCVNLAGAAGKGEQYNVCRTLSEQMSTLSSSCKSDCQDNENSCHVASNVTGRKASFGSIKTKDNLNGSGVLRYALHLRFLCCPLRKYSESVQGCQSDPLYSPRNSRENEQERRFYLYNDLRVVFPQRHTDSDEGKLNVEYHFPANPKYFDIGD
ncbi:hypothetical protein RDABS01_005800 [Bienertia sinuspersici]